MADVGFYRWIIQFFELLAGVIGLITWGRVSGHYLQKFSFVFVLVILFEFAGLYTGMHPDLEKYNPMIYRYFGTPLLFIFFYWLYYNYLKLYKKQAFAIIVTLSYVLAWLFEEVYKVKNLWFWFPSFSFGVGAIGILVLLVVYFLNFINTDDIISYKKQPMFWISIGLFLGYVIIIPLYILRNTLSNDQKELFIFYWKFGNVLTSLMYVFFAISFLCTKRKS
jgi:hypothetical protein